MAATTDDTQEEDGLEVEGLQGHLEPVQIDAGLRPFQGQLNRCYKAVVRNARYLGGRITLKTVVAPDGTVRQAQVAESDLGSWEVEKCLLAVVREMTFARPKGGNRMAEFSLPLDFSGGRGNMVVWEPERLDKALTDAKNQAALDKCSQEGAAPSDLTVTIYIGNRGGVKSVGFASAAEPISDEWGDCAAAVIADWKKFPDPRGLIAKSAFRVGG